MRTLPSVAATTTSASQRTGKALDKATMAARREPHSVPAGQTRHHSDIIGIAMVGG
jgi:hypothetical protein